MRTLRALTNGGQPILRRSLALACFAGLMTGGYGYAQVITGGVKNTNPLPRSVTPPDLTYARIEPPDAFAKATVEHRRKTMAAWSNAEPEKAGAGILPMIAVGLRDTDRDVTLLTLQVLNRIVGRANLARIKRERVVTNAADHPPVYSSLLQLVDHRDPTIRRQVVSLLTIYEVPATERLEAILLPRVRTEANPGVRGAMIIGLGERAKRGSSEAIKVVLDALEDPAAEVQVKAANVMHMARLVEALPRLIRLLNAQDRVVRKVVARALGAYGSTAKRYAPEIKQRYDAETDAEVKAQLLRVLEGLGDKSPASFRDLSDGSGRRL